MKQSTAIDTCLKRVLSQTDESDDSPLGL